MFSPVLKESLFYEKGVLTPEEFVQAGDELVAKCGSWRWDEGTSRKNYLPEKKQYLIARKIPSLRRANYGLQDAKEAVVDTDVDLDTEGWLETHVGTDVKKSKPSEVQEIDVDGLEIGDDDEAKIRSVSKPTMTTTQDIQKEKEKEKEEEVIGEIGDEGEIIAEQENDGGTLIENNSSSNLVTTTTSTKILKTEEPDDNLVKTRTYDISVTYDKYYQTPRVFLSGHNEHNEPLTPDEVMEDISSEHANKTVTVEPHPHTGIQLISIHPCKHASVMKKMLDQNALLVKEKASRNPTPTESKKKGKDTQTPKPQTPEDIYGINVNQYLFLFLKFISTVIPTIEYDNTASI